MPEVQQVRTVARGPLPDLPKMVHTRADLTSPEAREALRDVDVLFHLGAQLWRSRDGRQIEVNIDGTLNVLAANPRHVVLASSAAVYGAYPANPLPITESHPPRPNAECPYAWHKLEAERLCAATTPTAVTRISAVLGPHADPSVLDATRGYRVAVPAVRGVTQALQFLDENDAVEGLLACGLTGSIGTFNLATTDWLTAEQTAAVSGGKVLKIPQRASIVVSELGYRLRMLPFGADRACLINGPLALDPSHAMQTLNWSPRRTSAEVLKATLK